MAATMRPEPRGMQHEQDLLFSLAETREFKKAWVWLGGPVLVAGTQRNIAKNSQRKTVTNVSIDGSAPSIGLPLPEDCLMFSASPSGDLVLLARDSEKPCSVVWEVCNPEGQVLREIHVPTAMHGAVYSEGYISRGIAWSPNEKMVAYVAERPHKHTTPNWSSDLVANAATGDLDSADGEEKGSKKPVGSWTGQGPHEDDFGELFPGKICAGVYLLDLEGSRVALVEPAPDADDALMAEDPYGEMSRVTCGKPVFSPDSELVVFTAWPHIQKNWRDSSGNLVAAKKLGLVYCYNRECHLQVAKCSDVWKADKGDGGDDRGVGRAMARDVMSAHSAIFLPEIATTKTGQAVYEILFLSHKSAYDTGTHNACAALCSLKITHKGELTTTKTVVPVVGRPESREAFQGLFTADISQGCLHQERLYLNSIHRNNLVVLGIDLPSGKVEILTDPTRTWTIIGAGHGALILTTSGPGEIPSVHLYDLAKGATAPLLVPKPAPRAPPKLEVEVNYYHHDDNFDSILLSPKGKTALGESDTILLMPHGGPHSAHTCGWILYYDFLLHLGYTLLLVNYRGSVGFGNETLLTLPGNVGTNDVSDCITALDHALSKKDGLKRVGVMGGSHGGFLTLHLLGQHPERFAAGIVRNPVTSIAGMVSATDIPEWCYCEALGVGARPRCFGPTAKDLDKMLRCSPISYAEGVTAPTLWLLGKEDKRVRPLAAMDYIAALKAKRLPVKTIVFPEDSHPLSSPQTEFESFINVAWWLKKYL